jgi:glycosyltransferase involved in cell wall biosynthesis
VPFDVSVVVPTYNRAHLIGETLNRILDQTVPPSEVIVIDDGSTDDTDRVVGAYGDRVTYRKLDNRGAPAARDVGVKLSHGQHLAFCDSDDLWSPDYLARMAELFASSNRLDYAFSNFAEFTDTGVNSRTKFDTAPKGFWDLPKLHPSEESWIIEGGMVDSLIRFQPIFPSAVVISRDKYDRIGGFNPTMSYMPAEDLEFTLRCVQQGPIGVITHPAVQIRKHQGNVSANTARQLIGEICILNFVLNRHELPEPSRQVIVRDIDRRCREAIDEVFVARILELVTLLSLAVDHAGLNARQRLKLVIAALPQPLSRQFTRWLTPEGGLPPNDKVSRYLRMHLYVAVRDIVARREEALA